MGGKLGQKDLRFIIGEEKNALKAGSWGAFFKQSKRKKKKKNPQRRVPKEGEGPTSFLISYLSSHSKKELMAVRTITFPFAKDPQHWGKMEISFVGESSTGGGWGKSGGGVDKRRSVSLRPHRRERENSSRRKAVGGSFFLLRED